MPSVMHGEDYVRLGFFFGEKSRVAYIFDDSRFPPCTEYIISKSGGGQLDLLILDTSFKTLETIEFPCTKRGFLGRMTHEFDHHKDNECLEEWSSRYKTLETITNCLNKPYAECYLICFMQIILSIFGIVY
ncbi:BnaUnng04980D [Brassica napus]|uniref:BnaUnng04980D protein n=2 Tax=Brassica napus TaxID=3708 RepID=A0A078JZX9_BRANA|nr:BnaUnng04980D [Brassica napus]